MHQKHKKYSQSLVALSVLAMVIGSTGQGKTTDAAEHAAQSMHLGAYVTGGRDAERVHMSATMHQAMRLRRRLEKMTFSVPPLPKILEALKTRKDLLRRSVTVHFDATDGQTFPSWNATVQGNPLWVGSTFSLHQATFDLERSRIARTISDLGKEILPAAPVDVTLSEVTKDDRGVTRVRTSGAAQGGYVTNVTQAADAIEEALRRLSPEVHVSVQRTPGHIINLSPHALGPLELIGEGRSNFAGSAGGRVANIRKGLSEHIHNVIVGAGETFSFNDTLGSMTLAKGWQKALGIFNGDELRPVTGGGICQVATTVYRAAVLTGLPITSRKNHSLYVTYYEKHGIGLDATIFPGSQDFTFVNDTDAPILIQAYYDGFDAFVSVYGKPDGRTVKLSGPYFATNAPDTLTVNGRKILKSEIAWQQQVKYQDGRTIENTLVSRYKSIPSSVVAKYALPIVMENTPAHASAPETSLELRASIAQ